jgi:hypothetical protein
MARISLEVIEFEIVKDDNDEHQEKEEFSKKVIEIEIVMDENAEHPEKQEFPM